MKKIIFKSTSLFILSLLVSCTKEITTINSNPKAYEVVPGATLLSNAQRNLVDALTTPSVNTGIFRLLAQQWTETTYTDESRYDLGTRNIPQGFWNYIYRDVLRDLKASKDLIAADKTIDFPERQKNQLAIVDVMMVYSYSILVNTFGDIPYAESLDGGNLYPKYDDAATIYGDLLTRLDADLVSLNASPLGFATGSSSPDLIYAGNVSKWIKFANSLKLRLAMTLADVNPTLAKSAAESAISAGVFTANADKAKLTYLSSPPNTNPVWVNLVQSGRQDFVAANTLVNIMKVLNDPRVPLYFTFDGTGNSYSGGIYGTSNNYGTFSKPSVKLTVETFPGVLMDYAEVAFYLAEAAQRGFNAGGTVQTFYDKAITASILDWGGTSTDVTTYLAQTGVNFSTASGTNLQKIGTQKWIALYNRGFEAWMENRRFDAPILNTVPNPIAPFPLRFSYPTDEQNLNEANFKSASNKMAGGDLVTNKIFWDTH